MVFEALNLLGIVFDLDGTLYEDTDHFHYFAQRLAQRLPKPKRALFWQDLRSAWAGKHTLRLGRVYDRRRDLILETTPAGRVLKAWDWQGKPVSEAQINERYPVPVQFDMTAMISLGDGWWLPTACAYHYGLEKTYDAYLETKDYLGGEEAVLTPLPGLAAWLAEIKNRLRLVVVTNSDLADTNRLLANLGLEKVLTEIYPDAEKPQNAEKVFQQVAAETEIPLNLLLSVGDNYLNDIYPAAQLGMRTCLIDPHGLYGEGAADLVVRSLRDLYD